MAESFAREVFRRRHELKLTQQQVADRAEVSRATIVNAEKGDAVSPLTVARIRSVLDGSALVDASAEMAVLGQIVAAISQLSASERHRILAYLNSLYGNHQPGGGRP